MQIKLINNACVSTSDQKIQSTFVIMWKITLFIMICPIYCIPSSRLLFEVEEEQNQGAFVGLLSRKEVLQETPSQQANYSDYSGTETYIFLRPNDHFFVDKKGNVLRTKAKLDREILCRFADRSINLEWSEWITTGIIEYFSGFKDLHDVLILFFIADRRRNFVDSGVNFEVLSVLLTPLEALTRGKLVTPVGPHGVTTGTTNSPST